MWCNQAVNGNRRIKRNKLKYGVKKISKVHNKNELKCLKIMIVKLMKLDKLFAINGNLDGQEII